MAKITSDPRIMDPIRRLFPRNNSLKYGTTYPARVTTARKDNNIAAQPILGILADEPFWHFADKLRNLSLRQYNELQELKYKLKMYQ